jgi:SsrA-binding protein
VQRQQKGGEKLIVRNRRASYDYALQDRYEAGIVLVGSEVKSLRLGQVDLSDAYAAIEGNEVWLKQMQIAPFEGAKAFPHDPHRKRKLLLHAHEIAQLAKAAQRGGYTIVPTRIYFDANGRVKVELAIGKGKTKIDKRQEIARKDADREARAAMGRRRKE